MKVDEVFKYFQLHFPCLVDLEFGGQDDRPYKLDVGNYNYCPRYVKSTHYYYNCWPSKANALLKLDRLEFRLSLCPPLLRPYMLIHIVQRSWLFLTQRCLCKVFTGSFRFKMAVGWPVISLLYDTTKRTCNKFFTFKFKLPCLILFGVNTNENNRLPLPLALLSMWNYV